MYQTHKSYTIEEALSKLQKYCAYQDRCHKEVEQKLKQMRMIPEAIETIIGALIKDSHLNEERFAKAFVRGKFRIKKWGKVRGVLVIHFEIFPKKALKNRRLRRAFKSRQTQNIFMKGILAHLKNLICSNKKILNFKVWLSSKHTLVIAIVVI